MDSLAILERGHFFPTPSANIGSNNECPFCVARQRPEVRVGQKGIILSSYSAGMWVEFASTTQKQVVDSYIEFGSRNHCRYDKDHVLILPYDSIVSTNFLPHLSIRNCFILDELSVWMCNRSLFGLEFCWDDEGIIEFARTCWEKRLPVTKLEVIRILLAHGLPTQFGERAGDRFSFAIQTLVASHRRPALKKFQKEVSADDELLNFRRRCI